MHCLHVMIPQRTRDYSQLNCKTAMVKANGNFMSFTINSDNSLHGGSVGNILKTCNSKIVKLIIGGVQAENIVAIDSENYLFDMPALSDGKFYPPFGSLEAVAIYENLKSEKEKVILKLQRNMKSVSISTSKMPPDSMGSLSKDLKFEVGDTLYYPEDIVIYEDTTVSHAETGHIACFHRDANNLITEINIITGEAGAIVVHRLSHSPEMANDIDLLNRNKVISTLAELISNCNGKSRQTIGLLGKWGVGKSSLISHLKSHLAGDTKTKRFMFGEFNAWAYEHTKDLQAGIAHEAIKSLTGENDKKPSFNPGYWTKYYFTKIILSIKFKYSSDPEKIYLFTLLLLIFLLSIILGAPFSGFSLEESNSTLKRYDEIVVFAINIFWYAGLLFYIVKFLYKTLASPFSKKFFSYLRLPNYYEHLGIIPEMRKTINELCKIKLKDKILIFVIDDLDRCSPENIVKVFEAVRLVLDIDNVVVVIAMDHSIALSAITNHHKHFQQNLDSRNSRREARDYLSKIIHTPLLLSDPSDNELASYIKRIWPSQIADNDSEFFNTTSERNKNRSSYIQPDIETEEHDIHDRNIDRPKANKQPNKRDNSDSLRREFYSFHYWATYFGFRNPRQVKRLVNTYNFIRAFYANDVNLLNVEFESRAANGQRIYPIIISLFIMEYINSLEDLSRIEAITVLLKESKINALGDNLAGDALPDKLLTNELILDFDKAKRLTNVDLLDLVSPFVFPPWPLIEDANSNAKL